MGRADIIFFGFGGVAVLFVCRLIIIAIKARRNRPQ